MSASPPLRPPESMRPDRMEVMTSVGAGKFSTSNRASDSNVLVGAQNGARGLTTGIVTIAPSASLTYHTHTFTESITLLKGLALGVVEGREYELDYLDNVVVPRGLAHQFRNLSSHEPAILNIALASDSPARTLVGDNFPRESMPASSIGMKGAERVNQFRTAERFEAGPNTSFIDFFNEKLVPGIEMSGGYGLFQPGGRLPAHVHDFDESICIIDGEAVCRVEGRRHSMKNCATALQPRGRVHYFINESSDEMAMIWVYAGPSPIRIVVDERCATVEGNPWRDGASQ